MKKTVGKIYTYILALITGLMLGCPALTATAQTGVITVALNGSVLDFEGVNPTIISDRTMVPMRAIFEALGADVSWDDVSKTAYAHKDDTNVSIAIDDSRIIKNDSEIALDAPARLIDGYTFVPVRAVSEAFGCSVEWDADLRQVVIVSSKTDIPLTVSEIAPYSGRPYAEINNNIACFDESDKKEYSFEIYGDQDYLGRCTQAFANLCTDTMPTEERGSIGSVKPSGWQSIKYEFIDGKYLYNRCHLIGYQLSAENANRKNLITGTRYLNTTGMLPFENMVADYIKETGNHVLYRVTPVFEGKNLVASGVHMEAFSVEDNGEGINFNVYCYNVQPGVVINYADGTSSESGEYVSDSEGSGVSTKGKYVLNTNSKKFHLPNCTAALRISESNRQETNDDREALIDKGYSPCGICKP